MRYLTFIPARTQIGSDRLDRHGRCFIPTTPRLCHALPGLARQSVRVHTARAHTTARRARARARHLPLCLCLPPIAAFPLPCATPFLCLTLSPPPSPAFGMGLTSVTTPAACSYAYSLLPTVILFPCHLTSSLVLACVPFLCFLPVLHENFLCISPWRMDPWERAHFGTPVDL